jgi:CRISPR-associated protein Csh2
MSTIDKRSEILFLYDVKNANPNGDPMDANRPRIDEETGKCLVTDVRLKRTIRDYLFEKGYNGENGKDIFIREEDGKPVTGAQRAKSYDNKDEFISKFIDVRLFGAVSAPKKGKDEKSKTFHLTGPVQFGMGKTLNVVKENFIKGTGAFANDEKSIQRTFREEYNITYGLVAFHGVVNEQAAKWTKLTQEDVDELIDGIWNGTKNLLTRSKKGHTPRLLLKIDYSEKGYFIGELAERLKLTPQDNKREEEYEDIVDFTIDTAELNKILKENMDKIEKIHIMLDDRVKLSEPITDKK